MDAKSLNAFVKKHNDILGITGYARMPVAEKIKKIETALRRKSPALAGPREEYKKLKEGQKEKVKAGGGRAGGYKGSGQVTASGKQVKEQPKKPAKKAPQKPMASSFVPERIPKRKDQPMPKEPKETQKIFYSPNTDEIQKQQKGLKDKEKRDKEKAEKKAQKLKKSIIKIEGVDYEVRRLTEPGSPGIGEGQGIFDIKTGTRVEEDPDDTNPDEWVKKGQTIHRKNKKPAKAEVDPEIAKIVASATARAEKIKADKLRQEALSASSNVLNLTLDNVVKIGEREGGPVDIRRAEAEVEKARQVLIDQQKADERQRNLRREAKRKELLEKEKRDQRRRQEKQRAGGGSDFGPQDADRLYGAPVGVNNKKYAPKVYSHRTGAVSGVFNPQTMYKVSRGKEGFDYIDKDSGMKVGQDGPLTFYQRLQAEERERNRQKEREAIARGETPRLY